METFIFNMGGEESITRGRNKNNLTLDDYLH